MLKSIKDILESSDNEHNKMHYAIKQFGDKVHVYYKGKLVYKQPDTDDEKHGE